MLPKKNRAVTKEIDAIFKEGKFVVSPSLTFKYIINPKSKDRKVSVIAPKNIAKLAVKRNLLRRRGYTALKNHLDSFPAGIIGVFIFKKYQDAILTLEDEIQTILSKIN